MFHRVANKLSGCESAASASSALPWMTSDNEVDPTQVPTTAEDANGDGWQDKVLAPGAEIPDGGGSSGGGGGGGKATYNAWGERGHRAADDSGGAGGWGFGERDGAGLVGRGIRQLGLLSTPFSSLFP